MALSSEMMNELLERVKPGQSIASFGYPDILSHPDEVSSIVGNVGLKYLDKKVSNRHGVDYLLPEAVGFFESLGIKLDVYDIVKERGCEKLLDLNFEHPAEKKYDVVLDVGTLEHCFNIGQALINMASFVKKGGYILHENPFLSGNHGFYGLNPTLYHDFYTTNGFELNKCILINHKNGVVHEAPLTSRFGINGGECNIIAVAKRVSVKKFEHPIQTKYKKLLGEKSA